MKNIKMSKISLKNILKKTFKKKVKKKSPKKVTKNALQNAVSASGTLITTNHAIVELP